METPPVKMLRPIGPRATAAPLALVSPLPPAASRPARADFQLISNGGFEVGGLSGWTQANQLGSEGMFFPQTGTVSPITDTPVPAPPGGASAAMSDAPGPGS